MMESLIPIINNVQEVSKAIGDDDFRLPRIVMVGGQGSGKSSVLESLVGRSFLPKGTGVVTRTPLVLHLVHRPQQPGPQRRSEDGTLDAEEYGVFLHTDAIFTDFDEISREIQRQTEKIAGTNKGIGEEEITLKLYSPRLADMTLVDLPGLTKLPVGDQPQDVETQIRNLVLKHIDNTDAIIMAVLTANTDIANNESIKLAKDVDLKGERTLAVLTKADLMDAGTDASDILLGRVIPVKLGIVAVINRSQKDIDDKKSLVEVNKHERKLLRMKYPSLADRNGTSFLVSRLEKLFKEHITDYLLEVKTRVEFKISQAEALVDFYSYDGEHRDRGLLKIIREFSSAYSEEIRASATKSKSKTCECRARIYHILHETFKTELRKTLPLSPKKIYKEMTNSSNPEDILECLLREPIEHLKESSLGCAKLVHKEMQQSIKKFESRRELLAENFPELRCKIHNLLEKLLSSQLSLVEIVIREQIFFLLNWRIFCIRCRVKKGEVLNEEEYEKESNEKKCDLIAKFWQSELETARRIVHDDVTATVMDYMVTEVRNYLQRGLVKSFVYEGAGLTYLCAEDQRAKKREERRKALEALYKARDMIAQCKDYF